MTNPLNPKPMDKETIIEGNRLIAEFMHVTVIDNKRVIDEIICHHYYSDTLTYHSSWDWLMPVVEKIESLCGSFYFRIESVTVSIYNTDIVYNYPPAQFNVNAVSKINAVYNACIDFIRWYNSNTPKQ